jgi:hypothetical protein
MEAADVAGTVSDASSESDRAPVSGRQPQSLRKSSSRGDNEAERIVAAALKRPGCERQELKK